MAQKIAVELIDDTDGKPAAETVSFGLDGKVFEIDLSERNAKALRKACEPWIAAARRTGGRRQSGAAPSGVDTAAVRAWAASNGIELAPRGRIPGRVIEQYRSAGN